MHSIDFYIFKIWNPAGLPILPHLRRQMPSGIGDYCPTTSSLYLRQPRQSLTLGLKCFLIYLYRSVAACQSVFWDIVHNLQPLDIDKQIRFTVKDGCRCIGQVLWVSPSKRRPHLSETQQVSCPSSVVRCMSGHNLRWLWQYQFASQCLVHNFITTMTYKSTHRRDRWERRERAKTFVALRSLRALRLIEKSTIHHSICEYKHLAGHGPRTINHGRLRG